jgi:hypothetical protein
LGASVAEAVASVAEASVAEALVAEALDQAVSAERE